MIARAQAVVPVDYEDMKSGFQSGKAAALSDWSFRKDKAEFEVLVNRLRVKKWAKENPQRRREIANRYAAKPEVVRRQVDQQRQERHEKHRSEGRVIACAECGSEFCLAKPKRGIQPKYCSKACALRERYQRITPGARRIKPKWQWNTGKAA